MLNFKEKLVLHIGTASCITILLYLFLAVLLFTLDGTELHEEPAGVLSLFMLFSISYFGLVSITVIGEGK